MKVPARRRGNALHKRCTVAPHLRLNESPRPKAGKCLLKVAVRRRLIASMKVPARRRGNGCEHFPALCEETASMKVPARRRGNSWDDEGCCAGCCASMKVPARRRGNTRPGKSPTHPRGLNESPRPKAGKFTVQSPALAAVPASMKVPARRRGNLLELA